MRVLFAEMFARRGIQNLKSGIDVAFPFADMCRDGVTVLMRHGQRKCHKAVTALDSREGGFVNPALGPVLATEIVAAAFANRAGNVMMVRRIHGQCQGRHTVAIVNVLVCMFQDVGASLSDNRVETVLVVPFTCTNVVGQFDVVNRQNHEVQVDGAVAAKCGLQMTGVNRVDHFGCQNVEAVLVILFTQTERTFQFGGLGLVHNQIQDRGAVTAVDIRIRVIKVSGSRGVEDGKVITTVGHIITSVRHQRVAFLRSDVQVQRHNAVTTMDR